MKKKKRTDKSIEIIFSALKRLKIDILKIKIFPLFPQKKIFKKYLICKMEKLDIR